MDLKHVLELVTSHKYLGLSAVLIFAIARMMKDDTKGPSIPPRLRTPLVIVLGVAAGILERVSMGVTWEDAVFDGISAALLATMGHQFLIESVRGGKEIRIPGLMRPSSETDAPKA